MARRGKDNDHTKSSQLRRRGQYRIQHVMVMMMMMKDQLFEDRPSRGQDQQPRTQSWWCSPIEIYAID